MITESFTSLLSRFISLVHIIRFYNGAGSFFAQHCALIVSYVTFQSLQCLLLRIPAYYESRRQDSPCVLSKLFNESVLEYVAHSHIGMAIAYICIPDAGDCAAIIIHPDFSPQMAILSLRTQNSSVNPKRRGSGCKNSYECENIQ